MWMPALMAASRTRGMASVLAGNPKADTTAIPAWAARLNQAHQNAAENLPAFIGVCVAAVLAEAVTPEAIFAAFLYSYARIAHAIFYVFSVAFVRTASFMTSWVAILYIGLAVLGKV